MSVAYQGHAHTIEAPMLGSLKHDMILGIDFWRSFGIRPVVAEISGIEA